MSNKSYTAKDIETLSFRDAVRERVAMYMGSADNQGVLKDNYVTVADNARGIPFGIREDGTEAMEAIYTMPHTGGKFNEKVYQNVAGMNGIGAKGVALSSSWFNAISCRDGQAAELVLKDGIKEHFEIHEFRANRN